MTKKVEKSQKNVKELNVHHHPEESIEIMLKHNMEKIDKELSHMLLRISELYGAHRELYRTVFAILDSKTKDS